MIYRVKLTEDGAVDLLAADRCQQGPLWCDWTTTFIPPKGRLYVKDGNLHADEDDTSYDRIEIMTPCGLAIVQTYG